MISVSCLHSSHVSFINIRIYYACIYIIICISCIVVHRLYVLITIEFNYFISLSAS